MSFQIFEARALVSKLNELVPMVDAQNKFMWLSGNNIYSKSRILTNAIGVDQSVKIW